MKSALKFASTPADRLPMTTTLHHRYPARVSVKLMRKLILTPLMLLKLPNLAFGSKVAAVRITSRSLILLGAVAGMWMLWGRMHEALLNNAERSMASGKVLEHVHSTSAIVVAAAAWVVLALVVGGALHALAAGSDKLGGVAHHRSDDLENTAITLWIVLAIAAIAPVVMVAFNSENPTDSQTASLYFTEPKPVYLANDSREALELAADLHLAVDSCRPHEVGPRTEELPVLACRTKKGITLKMATAAAAPAAPAAT